MNGQFWLLCKITFKDLGCIGGGFDSALGFGGGFG